MIKSMTGFGRSEQVLTGREIIVEIKSVNHRYFEFSCRTIRGFGFLEEKAKTYIQQRVSRGKVDVYIGIGADDEKESVVSINHSLAQGYINALRELGQAYNISDDITVSSVAKYSDIFTVHQAAEDEDKLWEDVQVVLDNAIDKFVSMRQAEGKRMQTDLENRSKTILELVSQVEQRSPQTVLEYRTRLQDKMNELLSGASVDAQRILTEAAIFADKVAVDEETVRLRSHFKQMEQIMSAQGAVGRKLDFILQEMNREANTIGSKVQDAQLAHVVVDIKAELEKIREQVQNIE
ncbi:MAG TPA: YicC family protein [Clostridiales bacterium]|nr:YicC family protein [Clostridiales bacterium]